VPGLHLGDSNGFIGGGHDGPMLPGFADRWK
jgi:hypothetical protein